MKKMRKLAGVLLALVMALSLTVNAWAASGTNTNDGKITVDNAVVGQTYAVYELLALESFDTEKEAYSYKATAAWKAFVEGEGVADVYLVTDEEGYVTWKDGADVAAFAKLALAYAKANGIAATAAKEAAAATVEFTELNLGYYLVDSSLGTICSLDTTAKEVTIHEKNEAPQLKKEVQEDSDLAWGPTNDADIGQTVNFKSTVTAKKGAVNYVLHDVMTAGLTLDENSIAIAGLTRDTDYTVAFHTADGCDFEITFAQAYLDTITADTELVVTYSAVLNKEAVIYDEANINETWLAYGGDIGGEPEFETPKQKTETYTYTFDLVKTDEDGKLLPGAEFELYKSDKTTKIALVDLGEGVYRVATAEDAETVTTIVVAAGTVTVKGLDTDTYFLKETKAPAGYNLLAELEDVVINKANLDAAVEAGAYVSGGVQIVNKAGAVLPDTGGMGTTVLYIVGGLLVLAAVALLVTKRRMKNDD